MLDDHSSVRWHIGNTAAQKQGKQSCGHHYFFHEMNSCIFSRDLSFRESPRAYAEHLNTMLGYVT
jgi:hypothetical protein